MLKGTGRVPIRPLRPCICSNSGRKKRQNDGIERGAYRYNGLAAARERRATFFFIKTAAPFFFVPKLGNGFMQFEEVGLFKLTSSAIVYELGSRDSSIDTDSFI